MSKINEHMKDTNATAADIREIQELMGWSIRELAAYWDCTEAGIYAWIRNDEVTRGISTWAVRKTLEEARAQAEAAPPKSRREPVGAK